MVMIKKPNPTVFSFSSLSLYNFNKVIQSWNMDFLQLMPGKFSANLKQCVSDDFQLGYAKFNRTVKQEGLSPKGVWTFAFVNEVKIYWRNYKVQPNSIIIYAPGSEINAVSGAGFEVMTFSISEEYLFKIAKEEGLQDFYHTLKSIDVLNSKSLLWSKLRKAILNEIDTQIQNPNVSSNQIFKEKFTKELLALLKDASISKEKVSGEKRTKLLYDVERFIIEQITEPLTVSKLAFYFKISERTLLYAFKNRFDIGTKEFMLVLKLNHLYHKLHDEKSRGSIASLARESGFWHMGQLYKDYKHFFGELPSETLKKRSIDN